MAPASERSPPSPWDSGRALAEAPPGVTGAQTGLDRCRGLNLNDPVLRRLLHQQRLAAATAGLRAWPNSCSLCAWILPPGSSRASSL